MTCNSVAAGRWRHRWWAALVTLAIVSFQLAVFGPATAAAQPTNESVRVTVFASGLNDPRGLTFGPNGTLYVAEGGLGGSHSTVGKCKQVPVPVGPYTGGYTARISEISSSGTRTTVAHDLPSDQTSAATGSLISGVADVAFIGNTMFALLAGAGCSHGVPKTPNGIVRINPNGTWNMVANLSAFLKTHPVAHPNADDFEPDGTWYSMVAVGGLLYAVEPNHGELDQINPWTGAIQRVKDISEAEGHVVPTAVAYRNGAFYVGNLNTFPVVAGSSHVFRIIPGHGISTFLSGLTTVVGVAFDQQGRMYVLEMSTVSGSGPTAGTGAVVRINANGTRTTVVSGLTFPTAMAFGPGGDLYISDFGFGTPPGTGEIVRADVD